jgi:hypothetical protein
MSFQPVGNERSVPGVVKAAYCSGESSSNATLNDAEADNQGACGFFGEWMLIVSPEYEGRSGEFGAPWIYSDIL